MELREQRIVGFDIVDEGYDGRARLAVGKHVLE